MINLYQESGGIIKYGYRENHDDIELVIKNIIFLAKEGKGYLSSENILGTKNVTLSYNDKVYTDKTNISCTTIAKKIKVCMTIAGLKINFWFPKESTSITPDNATLEINDTYYPILRIY